MIGKLRLTGLAALLVAAASAAVAAEGDIDLPRQEWSFNSVFGTYNEADSKRGLQVYTEVCAACHSLSLVSYRHLSGIGLGENEIKAVAASVQISDGPDDQGEMFDRAGLPSDRFKAPFANEQAARAANNGAYPPDLSLMCKARLGGADYTYAILTGYEEPPAGFQLSDGMSYNKYFAAGAHQIAMPPPLSEGGVAYADGTDATVAQMAEDVTHFLCWAAEPNLNDRHRIGVAAMLFLIVLTACLYAVYRKVWSGLH
jgi:ubiquinol-cytochrome c reductase cytochrome c1 subunit